MEKSLQTAGRGEYEVHRNSKLIKMRIKPFRRKSNIHSAAGDYFLIGYERSPH